MKGGCHGLWIDNRVLLDVGGVLIDANHPGISVTAKDTATEALRALLLESAAAMGSLVARSLSHGEGLDAVGACRGEGGGP